jgi:hypothetical protein
VRRWLVALLVLLGIVSMPLDTAARARPAAHTKGQAEVNVLRELSVEWKAWRRFGLTDQRTHLVVNNVEAVCRGRGRRYVGNRYSRFVCVVRPDAHRGREGLWLRYRALQGGRYRVRLLAYYRS